MNSVSAIYVIKMADDAEQSNSAIDDTLSGTDNIPASKSKLHQGNSKFFLQMYCILRCFQNH